MIDFNKELEKIRKRVYKKYAKLRATGEIILDGEENEIIEEMAKIIAEENLKNAQKIHHESKRKK